jgi:hypothetical protein
MAGSDQIPTGNAGPDVILRGGLPAHRMYLLECTPGSGKTTLGLQFLRQAIADGEKALYITLSETKAYVVIAVSDTGVGMSAEVLQTWLRWSRVSLRRRGAAKPCCSSRTMPRCDCWSSKSCESFLIRQSKPTRPTPPFASCNPIVGSSSWFRMSVCPG